jgi:hypothetical protein
MTIRDLGYKPYEGARLPPSNNSWVMLRQGLARAWGSWLVKIAVFLSIFPPLIACLALGAGRYFAAQMGQAEETVDMGSSALREMFRYETWLVVSLVTLGAGAAAIAEDLTFKAFQFYFSKPVTPVQYLAGRVSAIAILLFGMTFLGGLFVVLIAGVTAQPENRLADFGLLAPMLVYALVLSLFMASASVAVSALSPSRALTMSAWGLLFVVPHVIASIVDGIASGDFPWLYLASFTGLLGTVADALFKVEGDSDLQWFHAAPILLGLALLGLWAAHERLRRAEVVK